VPRCADLPTKQSELITELDPALARNQLEKVLLYSFRLFRLRESQSACGNAKRVRVDDDSTGDSVGAT
jgi:hypothetical protein